MFKFYLLNAIWNKHLDIKQHFSVQFSVSFEFYRINSNFELKFDRDRTKINYLTVHFIKTMAKQESKRLVCIHQV